MMFKAFAFQANLDFLFEKRNEPYKQYGEVSIAKEKLKLAEKDSRVSSSAREQAVWCVSCVC